MGKTKEPVSTTNINMAVAYHGPQAMFLREVWFELSNDKIQIDVCKNLGYPSAVVHVQGVSEAKDGYYTIDLRAAVEALMEKLTDGK